MRWLRWIAVLFLSWLVIAIVGAVVEGFWGGGERGGTTNWVDQSFGAMMWIGAALAVVFAVLLIAAALLVGTSRVARRLIHPWRAGCISLVEYSTSI